MLNCLRIKTKAMISFLNHKILLRSAIASLSFLFISFSATASPQQQNNFGTSIEGPKLLLMASDVNENTSVPGPHILPQSERLVNIVVTYNGFSADAQTAFQAAVDIWESILVGNQTVRIDANWTPLATNVLGSAGATYWKMNFTNAPQSNTRVPIALANQLCGCDLEPGESDINANFNSDYSNWYLGTDGATPAGTYDFMSVVLHENLWETSSWKERIEFVTSFILMVAILGVLTYFIIIIVKRLYLIFLG